MINRSYYDIFVGDDAIPEYSCSGDPYAKTFELRLNRDGVLDIVETGSTYIPDMIESFAESVKIDNILDRFRNGETDVLNQREGAFVNLTALPSNIFEAYRLIENGRASFDSLPADVKVKFNNSYSEFISSLGSDYCRDVFSGHVDTVVDKVDKEVTVEQKQ